MDAHEDHQKRFLINRNFAFLWGGQAISNIGDFVFDTTLTLWIATVIAHKQSWAPLAVSGLLLAVSLPTFLLGPIAGVFVDRWDKRQTMLRMDAVRAVLVLFLLIIPLLSNHFSTAWQLTIVYTITFLATICAQFFNPARFALIGDVVDEPQRARASALGQTVTNFAVLIGPPLAAPLLFSLGVYWALIINALSFVISFLAIFAVRISPRVQKETNAEPPKFFQELSEGLHFFTENHILATILISAIIATFGVGALNALDIFFVTQNLHASSNLYGFFATAIGAGSIVGALLSTFFVKRLGVVRTFWLGLVVAGLLLLVFARQTNFFAALVIFFLFGVPVAAINTMLGPLLLHITPRHLVGRVIAVFTPATSLVGMLSVILVGYLASTLLQNFHATILGLTFGAIDLIFTVTGLLVLLGGIYAMLNLRSVSVQNEGD